jgi:serine/threonine protein phosphatase PrpC
VDPPSRATFVGTSVGGDDAMTSPTEAEPEASIQLASGSSVGQVRAANEDSCGTFLRTDGTRLLVVADGMGGARGGATASQTALSIIAERFESSDALEPEVMLEGAVQAANARVFEMAQEDPELEGMGTTVVAFLLDDELRGTIAHVGDSRAYRYRRGHLEPITTDHSVVAEMQKRGLLSAEEAAVHPRRNEILRAVGVLPEVEVEVAAVDIAAGDRFLLCSDGLCGVVADDEMAAVVQTDAPARAVTELIRIANERGGPDNITVQILAIPADEAEGDPEATAPVELSAVGIEAIEIKRRERKQMRKLAIALAVASVVFGVYFLWQFLQSDGDTAPSPQELDDSSGGSRPQSSDSAVPAGETNLAPRDRFEIESEPARRGVPRDGGSH